MADEGPKRPSGPLEDTQLATELPARDASGDTLLATSPPPRTSMPSIAPPPDKRYQLGAELGRGGMGRVVEAYDTHLGRTVALKEVLPKGGNIDRRFQREVRITARLEHASIVPLYDSGLLADGRPFYVMRRVSGRPLDELIARAHSLEKRLALLPNVLAAIDAVAHAHRRGVIHRDLKPSNILVGELGETVLIDWGLAKVIGDSDEPVHDSLEPRVPSAADSLQTQVGAIFGTPGFMAPEQARGDELGPQGDVYALGATLYQLLVGKPPVAGTSATDVLESTMRHRIVPVTTACPGAPVELATIVDKALELEPDRRYPDAGALGEDVRRFLTGQLVAAHSYTPRQRLSRFARRHRAPLAVAALASVGIATLAWFSVHRIVVERDVATAASAEAREQRARADERAIELSRRADELLLLHARSLVDASPTAAIAVLKQFDGTGALLDEARALGRAAYLRGVGYGLPSLPDFTIRLEMTGDGTRLLQQSRTGQLQILDLDTRRVAATYAAPPGSWATWIADGRLVLIARDEGPPVLYDPRTGTTEPVGTEAVRSVFRTSRGEHAALLGTAGQLVRFDPATRQLRPVSGGPYADKVQLAEDGSWIAAVERSGKRDRLVVIDSTGRTLVERADDVVSMASSTGGSLAIRTVDGVFEVRPTDAHPVFARVPIDATEVSSVIQLVYRGERLYLVSHRLLTSWNGKTVARDPRIGEGVMNAQQVGPDLLVVTATDGRVHVIGGDITHPLELTSKPNGTVRVAAAPGSMRVAATTGDSILVWDLAHVVPEMQDGVIEGLFVTETRVVQPPVFGTDWTWWDLAQRSGGRSPLAVQPSMPIAVDTDEGRAMMLLDRGTRSNTAAILYPDGTEVDVEGVTRTLVRLVNGNAVIYSPGGSRVLGKVGTEQARELVTLDGDVQSIAPAGMLGYAALSKKGELVRGHFDGTGFARTRLEHVTEETFVSSRGDGDTLIGNGEHLLRWTDDIRELAQLPAAIERIQSGAAGSCVTLSNKDLYFVPAAEPATPRRLVVGAGMMIAADVTRVVSMNGANQLEVIELPSLATWTVPRLYAALPRFSMSPSGRTILQTLGGRTALVRIPEPASDFAAWLDELTNATHADGHVRWPW
jgi:serine/threonine protein kinase